MADAKIRLSVEGTAQVIGDLSSTGSAMAELEKTAISSGSAIKNAFLGISAAVGTLAILDKIKDMATLNARYETLGVSMAVVGRNAGYTSQQMESTAAALQKTGISMIESRQQTMRLVQAHIDLSESTKLARIAQDAAVIGNMNSSEAFAAMIHGIQTGQTDVLRTIGLNVSMEQAYKQMGFALHKNVDALSQNEKTQAVLNAVMEQGSSIAGTYEAAMDTAGKQMLSMTRYSEDLKVKQGEIFNEVLTVAVMAYTGHLKDANGEIDEMAKNGELKEWGHAIAGVFVTVANALDNVLTGMKMVGTWAAHQSASGEINSKFNDQQNKYAASQEWTFVAPVDPKIEAARAKALAAEQSSYDESQIMLAKNSDRFLRAFDERNAAVASKEAKSHAESLAREQDYYAKVIQVQKAYAGYSLDVQQSAQQELAKSFYGDNHKYSDVAAAPKANADSSYNTLIQSIKEKTAATNLDIESQGKLSDAEKMAIKIMVDLRDGTLKLTQAKTITLAKDLEVYLLAVKKLEQTNLEEAATKQAMEAQEKYIASVSAGVDKLKGQVEQQQDYNDRIGLTKEAIAALDAAKLEDQAVNVESMATLMEMIGFSGQLGDSYRAQAEELRKLAALKTEGAAKDANFSAVKEAGDYLDKYLDPTKAQTFGQALKGAFGVAGDSLGKLTSSMQVYSIAQGEADKAREKALIKYANDSKGLAAENIKISERETREKIGAYGDMASAAQGFFQAGSKGYNIMGAVSKSFHAAEIALELASIAPKLASGAATMFGQSGWGGFAGVAAMGAVMAGLGVSMAGGSGSGADMSAATIQKQQGTGTVFGSSDAKSDSIQKSIGLLGKNSDLMLPATMQMASSLKNIESSMVGLTNIIFRSTGVTDGSNMGIKTGTLDRNQLGGLSYLPKLEAIGGSILLGPLGAVLGKITGTLNAKLLSLWGKTSQSITDGGLQIGGSVGSLQQGQGINQYANVATTKSSWFGLSKSTTNSTQTQAVSGEIAQQFGMIFTNLQTTLSAAATMLGGSSQVVGDAVKSFVIDTTKISLSGLKGADLQNAINGVISGAMDNIAQSVFPELDKFRAVGEGYTETVVRIASDYASVDVIMQSIGASFGAVGIASVAAREHLIGLVGGVDKLAQQTEAFSKNYLTEAEQLVPVQKKVTEAMAALGLSGVVTRDQFKEAVLGLANSGALATEAGAATYAGLMNVADAFAKVHPAATEAADAIKAAADKLASINQGVQSQIDALINASLTTEQLRAKQIDGQDSSTVSLYKQLFGLQDKAKADADAAKAAAELLSKQQQQAQQAEQAAQQAQQAAQQITSAWQSVTDGLFGEVNRIRGLMGIGDASSLSTAQSDFSIATAQARAGDQNAAKSLSSLSQALLSIAEKQSGSAVDLARIRAMTSNSLQETASGYSRYGVTLPSFAVGSDYVPYDMTANIHEGEGILTRSENAARLSGANTARLEALVETLTEEVGLLIASQERNNEDTRLASNALNGQGQRPMLVKVVT